MDTALMILLLLLILFVGMNFISALISALQNPAFHTTENKGDNNER